MAFISNPVGENVDDGAVLARSPVADRLGEPRIIPARSDSIFHVFRMQLASMLPDPSLVPEILAKSDETRHRAATRPDFEAALDGLAPGDFIILERHIESMTLIRTHCEGAAQAVLVCDSHAKTVGLTSLAGAMEYVFALVGNNDFPLVYIPSKPRA